MTTPSLRLPLDLNKRYYLDWGTGAGGRIVSLEAWERGWGECLISYPVVDQAGHFSPVLLGEAVVSAIADLRAHQGGTHEN